MKKETNLIMVVPVIIVAVLSMVVMPGQAMAEGYSYPGGASAPDQWEDAEYQVLIKNVNIFDGKKNKLINGMDVVIIGEHIAKIAKSPIKVKTKDLTITLDGGGRTLMPGLIDCHAHLMLNGPFGLMESDFTEGDLHCRGVYKAKRYLMDGFTTIRDVGGPTFGLKRTIDAGLVQGPRIYPSGAFISQTSGHGDFRSRNDPNPMFSGCEDYANFARFGLGQIADGRAQVLAATRQQLMQGASQVKIMGGGGGSSKYDPMDTTQYTFDEMKAAVEARDDWNTPVCSHIFTDKAVNRALDAGFKTFEHAFFITEPTVKRIAKEGAFVVPQTWGISPELLNNPLLPKNKIPMVEKLQKEAKDFAPLLLKHNVKIGFATDAVGDLDDSWKARRFELYHHAKLFGSNFLCLKHATSVAGELLQLSGPRNPYPGKLGVIEEGALADILIVDGNPLKDLSVLGAYPKWFDAPRPKQLDTIRLIMKDGVFFKCTLPGKEEASEKLLEIQRRRHEMGKGNRTAYPEY
ncbi:MAG: metal-dependent hydrolase family protein [Planctomycetota bacterium]